MDWKNAVRAALEEISGVSVHYIRPAEMPSGTFLTYAFTGDVPGIFADDCEYAIRASVQADIWDAAAEKPEQLAPEVIAAMRDIGFERELCADEFDAEQQLYCKRMRFTALI